MANNHQNTYVQSGLYPGVLSNSQPNPPRSIYCCGVTATKYFGNPKGISKAIDAVAYSDDLYLCDACDFRFSVMRAADRTEQFVEEYKSKVAAREEEARKEQERHLAALQQMHYKTIKNYQNMQNYYGKSLGGLLGQAGKVVPQEQSTPAPESWLEKFKNLYSNLTK